MADADDNVTVDRSGDRPVRKDNRSLLHMLHEEIGKAIGVDGKDRERKVNAANMGASDHEGLMDAVDSAVSSAKGANPDY